MSNRRRTARRLPKSHTKLTCRRGALGLGNNILLEVLDLSEEGACLKVKENFSRGATVQVELTGLGYPRPITLAADVMRANESDDGTCTLGIRFEKAIPYAALQEMTRLVELTDKS